jgi:hypothetical protein
MLLKDQLPLPVRIAALIVFAPHHGKTADQYLTSAVPRHLSKAFPAMLQSGGMQLGVSYA